MHKPREAVTSRTPCYAMWQRASTQDASSEVAVQQASRDVAASRGLCTAPYKNIFQVYMKHSKIILTTISTRLASGAHGI